MKEWKCPNCWRTRKYEKELVMKVCHACQVEMVILDDLKGDHKINGK